MTRILAQLSILNAAALLAAFFVGIISWQRGGRMEGDLYPIHLYVGLFAVFCTLGLHCLVFIYFLGTGRWVKEVALAYELPDDPLPKLTRELKRQTFPPALLAMVVPIATAAAGMGQLHGEWHGAIHAALATATLFVNLWAFTIEYHNVATNAGVIDRVMQEVERIRTEKGLPSNAEAWEQQT